MLPVGKLHNFSPNLLLRFRISTTIMLWCAILAYVLQSALNCIGADSTQIEPSSCPTPSLTAPVFLIDRTCHSCAGTVASGSNEGPELMIRSWRGRREGTWLEYNRCANVRWEKHPVLLAKHLGTPGADRNCPTLDTTQIRK